MKHAIDTCGSEKFAFVSEDGRQFAKLTFTEVLAQCERGDQLYAQQQPYTAATSADPEAKNREAYAALTAAGVTLFTLGTRVLGIRYAAAKRQRQIKDEHLDEARLLLDAAMTGRHACREWTPFRQPLYDAEERFSQRRVIMSLREDEPLMTSIRGALRGDPFFAGESGAAHAAVYHAAVTTDSTRAFIRKLGCYCHGRPCYLRAVIMRRWKWRRTMKLIPTLRRARRAVLETTQSIPRPWLCDSGHSLQPAAASAA